MRTILLAASALLAVPAAAKEAQSGCALLTSGKATNDQLDQHYGQRAIAVIQAANRADKAALAALVDPQFAYVLRDGDNYLSARDRNGTEAAAELATRLSPANYRISTGFIGPYAVSRHDCEWNVTIQFTGLGWPDGVQVIFYFKDDRLYSAGGETQMILEGKLP